MAGKKRGPKGPTPTSFSKTNQPAGAKPYQFQPGQSGNPGGSPVKKPFRDALLRVLGEKPGKRKPTPEETRMDRVALALVRRAVDGGTDAVKEIADRVDGKVMQQVSHGGDPDAPPVKHKVEVVHTFVSKI